MGTQIKNIYVKLLDGTEALAPCRAVLLQKNIFRITDIESFDPEDPTTIWEFLPNDVVECEPYNDYLLATRLVESNFPNRRIYELIFKIVTNAGAVSPGQPAFAAYKDEIQALCRTDVVPQCKHPIIKEWRDKFCASVIV